MGYNMLSTCTFTQTMLKWTPVNRETSRGETGRQTDRQAGRQADRQRQTGRDTDRQTETQTDRDSDRQRQRDGDSNTEIDAIVSVSDCSQMTNKYEIGRVGQIVNHCESLDI